MAIKIVDNCRCEVCLAVDPNGRSHVFSDDPSKPVVMTGPIRGSVQLADGTEVDVNPIAVEANSAEHAAAIDRAIGEAWEALGHPDDVEIDQKTGKRVQRPFKYVDNHGRRAGKKG